MKTILIHTPTHGNNSLFNPDHRDNITEPLIYLRERLRDLGYRLQTSDAHPLDDCAFVWFHDSSSVMPYSGIKGIARWMKHYLSGRKPFRNLYQECISAGMQDRIALFLYEPPSVTPANWDPHLHALFPTIFTWHDGLVDGRKFIKVHVPTLPDHYPQVPEVPFAAKKLLVNISMNKISRHPRELYSARRTTIRHFERYRPHDFDLYGVGWNRPVGIAQKIIPLLRPSYTSYRGQVQNKWDVLPNYRFALCYENIWGEPGLVTEKIFDAMRSGCVPVYWGAPNIDEYVDEAVFIDRRKFHSDAALENFLTNVTEQEYSHYQQAIRTYLTSERFARFLAPTYAETIIRTLQL